MKTTRIGRSAAGLTLALTATMIAGTAPAQADYGDPLWLGYLQADVLSGDTPYRAFDAGTGQYYWVNWYTELFTNPGQVCPAGTTHAQVNVLVDGVWGGEPVGSTLRASIDDPDGGDSFTPTPSDHIWRTGGFAHDPDTSMLLGAIANGAELEFRHTCQDGNFYDPTEDPYYSFSMTMAAGGAWQILAQTGADFAEADITVVVPQAQAAPEGLKLSVKPGPVTLTGGTRLPSQVWTATGTLGTTTVDDDRQDATANDWSLTGQVSDFANAGATETIAAANLGWVPTKSSGAGTAGAAVAPNASGGLGSAKSFATGQASASAHVTTSLTAPLTLDVPAATPADTYVATLTLTLI